MNLLINLPVFDFGIELGGSTCFPLIIAVTAIDLKGKLKYLFGIFYNK